jgi:hypothetical protein
MEGGIPRITTMAMPITRHQTTTEEIALGIITKAMLIIGPRTKMEATPGAITRTTTPLDGTLARLPKAVTRAAGIRTFRMAITLNRTTRVIGTQTEIGQEALTRVDGPRTARTIILIRTIQVTGIRTGKVVTTKMVGTPITMG